MLPPIAKGILTTHGLRVLKLEAREPHDGDRAREPCGSLARIYGMFTLSVLIESDSIYSCLCYFTLYLSREVSSLHRSDLVHQLESMQPDHILLFPRLRNAPQITVQCLLRGGTRHWKVEQGADTTPVPYTSPDVQHVVDYLLQLRPLENFSSSLTLIREETIFETLP